MYTKLATLTLSFVCLGGCSTSVGFDWRGDFQTGMSQPGARPHTDGYRVDGRLVDDLGDYGDNPGICISNGEIVWQND